MKLRLLLLCLFTQMVVMTASAQTSLLIAKTNIVLPGLGPATTGDSTVYSYNSLHQPIEYKKWKFENNNWVLSYLTKDISYNASGQILSYLDQYWNGMNGWVNFERYKYTYDADGHELSQRCERWNGSSWFTLWLYTREWVFNANGQVITQTTTNSRAFYSYNAFDSLETTVYETLNNDGDWVNYLRIDYAYTPGNSKLMSATQSYWLGNDWVLDTRESYVYDADGYLLQKLSESWSDDMWVNVDLSTYAYDANHKLTYVLSKSWGADDWENEFQSFFVYDANSQELNVQFYIWSDTGWQLFIITNNYYSEFVSTKMPLMVDFQMSPNPASTSVVLRCEGLSRAQIIDIQGHSVLSQALNGQMQTSLDIGHLPAGAYFLQVTDANGQTRAKPLQISH